MSKHFPRTMWWRLGTALLVVQFVITCGLCLYIFVKVRAHHEEQSLDKLQRVSAVVAAGRDTLIRSNDFDAIQEAILLVGRRSGVRTTVILEDGTVVADSESDPGAMDNHRRRPEIEDAFRDGSGFRSRYSRTVRERLMYFAERFDATDGSVRVLRTAVPLTEIADEFAELARVIVLAAVFMLGAAALATFLISRHFGSQLSALADAAERFARGELKHRVHRPGTPELASLADQLNLMAEQLHDRIIESENQRAELRAILESMSSGVIALDLEQRILHLNHAAAKLFQTRSEAARGRLFQEVIRQPDLDQIIGEALAGDARRVVEFRYGVEQPRQLRASCETLVDSEDRARGLLVVVNDVTELRRLEAMRSDFAANVSHELRTPITNIKGYVETLLELGPDAADSAQRFLSIIKQNTDRLVAIIDDVLELTRLEESQEGHTALERTVVSIDRLVQPVIAQYRAAAQLKSIEITTRLDPALRVAVMRDLMQQAIGNLVSNAIKYSPAGSAVTVASTAGNDGMVIVEISDQGPGIPEQHLPRLFERFYRVDKGRSRQLGGTGLGLAIVKHIMRAHGGAVEVESRVGSGSTFRLVIPAGNSPQGE